MASPDGASTDCWVSGASLAAAPTHEVAQHEDDEDSPCAAGYIGTAEPAHLDVLDVVLERRDGTS